jgi:hypothetical protein
MTIRDLFRREDSQVRAPYLPGAGSYIRSMEQTLSSTIRILIADDYKDWRRQVRLQFQARLECQVIAEAAAASPFAGTYPWIRL